MSYGGLLRSGTFADLCTPNLAFMYQVNFAKGQSTNRSSQPEQIVYFRQRHTAGAQH